jgi:hypothetical protein
MFKDGIMKIYGPKREPVTRGYGKLGLLKKGVRKRTAIFWVITQRVVVIYYRLFGTNYQFHPQRFLNPEDVTDKLSRNVGKKLPLLAA